MKNFPTSSKAMAFFKSTKAPGIASGLVLGGFCLLGLILAAIAATIVLSLISLYTPNNSQQGYGDGYRINALGIKSLYTNISTGFTNNNSIVVNRDLSDACTGFLVNSGQKNVAGCVINPHNAVASGLSISTLQRRKRDTTAELISIATASIYYENTCGKLGDKGKSIYSSGLSDCVKLRLLACNRLFNNSVQTSSSVTAWPVNSPIAYAILSNDHLSYVFATVSAVFGIQPSAIINYFSNSGILSAGTQSELNTGCQYIGPISLADIAAIIAAQNGVSYTTTSYYG